MTQEEKTLSEAMSYARVSKMPSEYKPGSQKIWTRAIVKVKKINNKLSYALAMNDGCNKPRIVKDFGDTGAIKAIEAIYPYEFAPSDIVPSLRNKKDIEQFLVRIGCNAQNVQYLLSNDDADGNPKSEEQKESDKQKVKSIIEKYVVEQSVVLARAQDRAKALSEKHDIYGETSQRAAKEFEEKERKRKKKEE